MWGFGGRHYWVRKREKGDVKGVVVLFAWISSQDKHLKHYTDFYASFGWNSLVCHAQFLNLFLPDKAAILALGIVNELLQELKLRPCPVVFSSFSGGPKACMYKVLQIIEGKCQEQQLHLHDYRLVRDCLSGFIFDSTPVDFVSDLGTRFVLHPTVLKMAQPPPPASWIAQGVSYCLDGLFLGNFESQRAEYWQTLYSTIAMKAPYLIFSSEDDDLAPFRVIRNFALRLSQLGADVNLVTWESSPHVGHLRLHPREYKAAVAELIEKATGVYSSRIHELEGEEMVMEAANKIGSPREASGSSFSGRNGMAVDSASSDLFVSSESYEHALSYDILLETALCHGVLGRLLVGMNVPGDVEDWDVMPIEYRGGRRSSFHPTKCMRRSRL